MVRTLKWRGFTRGANGEEILQELHWPLAANTVEVIQVTSIQPDSLNIQNFEEEDGVVGDVVYYWRVKKF